MRYYSPDEFAQLKVFALSLGYGHVESGPLVRSSYHAEEQVLSVVPVASTTKSELTVLIAPGKPFESPPVPTPSSRS